MENGTGRIWFERLIAGVAGGCVAVLAWFTGNGLELPPELWDEIAVAAGLRPPPEEFPLLWQLLLSFFIDAFGITSCIGWLKILGPVSLGVLTVMTFSLFSHCLPKIMKGEMGYTRWGRLIVRTVSVQGVLLFVCSEPVWLAGRVFSPEMFSLVLTMAAVLLALYGVKNSSSASLIAMGALCGVLSAENILLVLMPVAVRFYLGFVCYSRRSVIYGELPVFTNPLVFAVAMRRMACAFALGWFCTAAAGLAFYCGRGGGGETDVNVFAVAIGYLLNHFYVLRNAATPLGWFFMFAVVVFPLAVVLFKLRELTDIEKLLPFPYACFLAAVGTVSVLQSAGFPGFHFWKWGLCAVHDRYLLCMGMLGTSIVAMASIAVFAVDVFYRNYSRLLLEVFIYEAEDEPVVQKISKSFKVYLKFLRFAAHVEPAVVLALVIPFKFNGAVRDMSAVINDIAYQTAAECGDADMLFSDGSCDPAVEVAAAENGKRLKAVSMMSGSGKYDSALRLRGANGPENAALLKAGAAEALRTWVHGRSACVSNIAVQVGLELWQRNGIAAPEAGGLVARTAGFPKGEAVRWIGSAEAIAGRILEIYGKYNPGKAGYPELNRLFTVGQWRIARMCRIRADRAEWAGNTELSKKENSLADKLDELNPEWRKVQEQMTWIGSRNTMHLTPREGLKLGLQRADFRMAGSYAKRILATDPDDMDANFALGMECFTVKRYEKAEGYLKRCLIRAPDEPAVLNNLAVVQLRLGKLDEAETNAVKALERFPKSHEIKATLRHLKKARDVIAVP